MAKYKSALRTNIAKRHQAMLDDVDYIFAINQLDQALFIDVGRSIREFFIGYINCYYYHHAVFVEKAYRGRLSPEMETRLAQRGDEALKDYRQIVHSVEKFGHLCQVSGLAPVLERHLPNVFKYFHHNPNYVTIIDGFRDLGVTELHLSWIVHLLEMENYDVLHCASKERTIEGLVRRVRSCLPRLERFVHSLHATGLVVFEGAMPGDNGYPEAANDAGTDGVEGGKKARTNFIRIAGNGTSYGEAAVSAGLALLVVAIVQVSL